MFKFFDMSVSFHVIQVGITQKLKSGISQQNVLGLKY